MSGSKWRRRPVSCGGLLSPPDPVVMELQGRLALEGRRLEAEIALKARKHADDTALKRLELELKYGALSLSGPIGGAAGSAQDLAPWRRATATRTRW